MARMIDADWPTPSEMDAVEFFLRLQELAPYLERLRPVEVVAAFRAGRVPVPTGIFDVAARAAGADLDIDLIYHPLSEVMIEVDGEAMRCTTPTPVWLGAVLEHTIRLLIEFRNATFDDLDAHDGPAGSAPAVTTD